MASPDSMDMSSSNLWDIVKDKEAWCAAVHRVTKIWTGLSDCLYFSLLFLFLEKRHSKILGDLHLSYVSSSRRNRIGFRIALVRQESQDLVTLLYQITVQSKQFYFSKLNQLLFLNLELTTSPQKMSVVQAGMAHWKAGGFVTEHTDFWLLRPSMKLLKI